MTLAGLLLVALVVVALVGGAFAVWAWRQLAGADDAARWMED